MWIPQAQPDPSHHEEHTNKPHTPEAGKQAGTERKDAFGEHLLFSALAEHPEGVNRHSQVGTFSSLLFNSVSASLLSQSNSRGDHADVVQKEPPALQLYPEDVVFGWVVICSKYAGNLSQNSVLLTCALVCAETASFGSPTTPGSLEIAPRNLAAAICDADAPCSGTLSHYRDARVVHISHLSIVPVFCHSFVPCQHLYCPQVWSANSGQVQECQSNLRTPWCPIIA